MAGVEEVRAGIAQANEKASASIAALQQAAQSLGEAQQILSQATEGSSQNEVNEAHRMIAEALNGINDTQGTVEACISSAESYAARL
ncbi:hypothetical protein [Amycolatopsis anabasis]|uniref:hypothetical protein n=1 Tax=Amycolatopsis anabasis TaxID=1840409 RepID=UPI00131B4192|nr:hypothetical protein [Amycolatopsis anabasis]